MKKPEATKDQQLLEKLIRGRRTNLSEWFEKITDEFCKDQAVQERTSVETIKKKFYTDLIEQFLCSLPTLLFWFFIEKGVVISLNLVHYYVNHHKILTGQRNKISGRNSLPKGSGHTS